MQTKQRENLQDARQRLLDNAGPEAFYHLDPYRAYERLQKQYREDWKVFASFSSVVASYITSGVLLALVLPFLVPVCSFERAFTFFPLLGIYGALSAISTHVIWDCLRNSNLPKISKMSLTIFGSTSSALMIFGNTVEFSIHCKIDTISVLTFLAFCLIPGLTGSLLVFLSKKITWK
jgi:hypothetical protein